MRKKLCTITPTLGSLLFAMRYDCKVWGKEVCIGATNMARSLLQEPLEMELRKCLYMLVVSKATSAAHLLQNIHFEKVEHLQLKFSSGSFQSKTHKLNSAWSHELMSLCKDFDKELHFKWFHNFVYPVGIKVYLNF